MTVQSIIKNKPHLAWDIKDATTLSGESVLEHVSNYGDWNDVQEFISIKGNKETAELFRHTLTGERTNYSPEIREYFSRYFNVIHE